MKDIAAAANVGLGTVSRVLSNKGPVAPATRRKVEEAAKRLNYRPSAIGRGLKSQHTSSIGLIVADISNYFYGEFAEGVLGAAKAMNRHVIVHSSGEDKDSEREYIDLLLEHRVEGIIAFPTGGNIDSWTAARHLGVNLVFADRVIPDFEVPSVIVDNEAASRELTEYLLALGHRRIGYLGGPTELTSGSLRERGFRDAHAEAGAHLNEDLIVRSKFTRRTAYASALRLLEVPSRPTALIASNNVLGEAMLEAVHDRGLTVPDDISMTMFDDVPWAHLVRPAMTTIAQPAERMGEAAVRLVTDPHPSTTPLVLPTEMILRQSVRAWHEPRAAQPT